MPRSRITEREREEIETRFTDHAPTTDAEVHAHQDIREQARTFAFDLSERVPPSRELSIALTKLDECVMAANAGIARRGLREDGR